MGCNHTGSTWSEVERVATEYVERGLLDEDVQEEVEELLSEDDPKEALEVALQHYRDRRNLETDSR